MNSYLHAVPQGRHFKQSREAPCRGCKLWHRPGDAHLGDPRDWSAERINLLGHRELAGSLELLLADLEGMPRSMAWADRLALAVHRRCDDATVAYLTTPELADPADRVLYIAPAGTETVLRCGVVLHLSGDGRRRLEGGLTPIVSRANEPLALVALTGVWLQLAYPPRAQTEAQFRARGAKLAANPTMR